MPYTLDEEPVAQEGYTLDPPASYVLDEPVVETPGSKVRKYISDVVIPDTIETGKGILTFPYHLARKAVDPIAEFSRSVGEQGKVTDAIRSKLWQTWGGNAGEIAEGVYQSMARPSGIEDVRGMITRAVGGQPIDPNLDIAKESWTQHPAGSLAAVGLPAGLKVASKLKQTANTIRVNKAKIIMDEAQKAAKIIEQTPIPTKEGIKTEVASKKTAMEVLDNYYKSLPPDDMKNQVTELLGGDKTNLDFIKHSTATDLQMAINYSSQDIVQGIKNLASTGKGIPEEVQAAMFKLGRPELKYQLAPEQLTALNTWRDSFFAPPKPKPIIAGGTIGNESGAVQLPGSSTTTGAVEALKVPILDVPDIQFTDWFKPSLMVADKYEHMKYPIEQAIKGQQDYNLWVDKKTTRLKEIFDKHDPQSFFGKLLGKRSTTIENLDDMVRGVVETPTQYKGLVGELKTYLEDIRGSIVSMKVDEIRSHLDTKVQKDLFDFKRGVIKEAPANVKPSTIAAVDAALEAFEGAKSWGLKDYFPAVYKGQYKYLLQTDKGARIVGSGETLKQAKANFAAWLDEHPESAQAEFYAVNDYASLNFAKQFMSMIDEETGRPVSNGHIGQYMGTKLSPNEFFRMQARTEKLIKEQVREAGGGQVKGIKVDLRGIAIPDMGNVYSRHFQKKTSTMKGEETDAFRALSTYIFSAGRKIKLEPVKKDLKNFANQLPPFMSKSKTYVNQMTDALMGNYSSIDALVDNAFTKIAVASNAKFGTQLGPKPFALSRAIGKVMWAEASAKLGYAPVKTAINRMSGVHHILVKTSFKDWAQGRKLLKTPEGLKMVEELGHLTGIDTGFAESGYIKAQRDISSLSPLGFYNRAELRNRPEALAAGYQAGLRIYKGDVAKARQYGVDCSRLTQGLYNTTALPLIINNPIASPIFRLGYQFKQFLSNEMRFMGSLTPGQWAKYIPGLMAMGGTRGGWLMAKGVMALPIVSQIVNGSVEFLTGDDPETLLEKLNSKGGDNNVFDLIHRGIPGLLGVDVSAPATWQIPTTWKEFSGTGINDMLLAYETFAEAIKGRLTDDEYDKFIHQLLPVGWNMWRGMQLLTMSKTRTDFGMSEDPRAEVRYYGEKKEGVVNLISGRTVRQSQASDTVAYYNKKKADETKQMETYRDKLFASKSSEVSNKIISKMLELKGLDPNLFIRASNGEQLDFEEEKALKQFSADIDRSLQDRQLGAKGRSIKRLPKHMKRDIEQDMLQKVIDQQGGN